MNLRVSKRFHNYSLFCSVPSADVNSVRLFLHAVRLASALLLRGAVGPAALRRHTHDVHHETSQLRAQLAKRRLQQQAAALGFQIQQYVHGQVFGRRGVLVLAVVRVLEGQEEQGVKR